MHALERVQAVMISRPNIVAMLAHAPARAEYIRYLFRGVSSETQPHAIIYTPALQVTSAGKE